jgi:hypothetical protein
MLFFGMVEGILAVKELGNHRPSCSPVELAYHLDVKIRLAPEDHLQVVLSPTEGLS